MKFGLELAEHLVSYFLNEDASEERRREFNRERHNCLAVYKEIYKYLLTKSNQSKLSYIYFQKIEYASEDNVGKCTENDDFLPK